MQSQKRFMKNWFRVTPTVVETPLVGEEFDKGAKSIRVVWPEILKDRRLNYMRLGANPSKPNHEQIIQTNVMIDVVMNPETKKPEIKVPDFMRQLLSYEGGEIQAMEPHEAEQKLESWGIDVELSR